MILVGNQRGGARDLALHLTKSENERVDVHELRGFVADDLLGAFRESEAISKGTRCKQHLFSLSLNPPPNEDASTRSFEDAVDRAEKRLGLEGQPRAIVFHEKDGRRHAHAVWSRIDAEEMKAVQLSFTRRKLQEVARELYLEHGWTMPRGFVRSPETDPRNYSLQEWQQAKRARHDPAALKAALQDAWAASDSRAAFAQALRERGLILAKGDRRGHVAINRDGEAYAISRWTGARAKQVRDKLGAPDDLPDVDQAHDMATKLVTDRLRQLRQQNRQNALARMAKLRVEERRQERSQRLELLRLAERQAAKLREEEIERSSRIRKGWRGLMDYLTGKRRRIEAENRDASAKSQKRDLDRRAALEAGQQKARNRQQEERAQTASTARATDRELKDDIRDIEEKRDAARTARKQAFEKKRWRSTDRPRRRRSRDGPAPST
ncbi:MAG: relaxase/mobilization nuclease domain-containing protein [Pseudomonadota bacterium]